MKKKRVINARNRDLVKALAGMVARHCDLNGSSKVSVHSYWIRENAAAIKLLEKYGLLEITCTNEMMVRGVWMEKKWERRRVFKE